MILYKGVEILKIDFFVVNLMALRFEEIANRIKSRWRKYFLTAEAREEARRDHLGLLEADPGTEKAIERGIKWLEIAQDCSASHDGGVAAGYSFIFDWLPSYPETTGYIVPTMLAYANSRGDNTVRQRARRMLDWLVSIQLPEGGFQGGMVNSVPKVPVTFNTGQILRGLASGVREFGEEYRAPMRRAADWLVETQDKDGCWRKYPTPFASPGMKSYETHVVWGLFEAAKFDPDKPYKDSALANIRWTLKQQRENGWFDECCIDDPSRPTTHTLGYVLRGVLEGYEFSGESDFLVAACKTADGLLGAMRSDGFIKGRFYSDWKGAVDSACLTGIAQISICWLMLYQFTSEKRYRDAAFVANSFLRRTMKCESRPEIRGAIKGSYPIDGDYCPYEYPNWACKFFIDANMLEQEIRKKEEGG